MTHIRSYQNYGSLIEALLSCPTDEEVKILAANQELIDHVLVETMQQIATSLVKLDNQEGANFLINLIPVIEMSIGVPSAKFEETFNKNKQIIDEKRKKAQLGLIKALLDCPSGSESKLLQAHVNLLDGSFVTIMTEVALNLKDQGRINAFQFLFDLMTELSQALAYRNGLPYIKHIENLLRCPQGQERQLLNSRPDLFNYGLVRKMEEFADLLEEQGRDYHPDWLRTLAAQIADEIKNPSPYLKLVHDLINCAEGEEINLLNAHQELLDTNLVQMMTQVADVMEQGGDVNQADMLRHFAARLNYEQYEDLLIELLQATQDSQGNSQFVYPILQNSLDKLNDDLIQVMKSWGDRVLTQKSPSYKEALAGCLMNLSNSIQHFPLGNRAVNLEIAIAAYELGLTAFTLNTAPDYWAKAQNNLGLAYENRIQGDRAKNLEQAIAYYQKALEIYTYKAFPVEWAITQNNLGNAYAKRIRGQQAENYNQAIACYQNALQVRTRESFPEKWAQTQNNLGLVYSDLIQGNPVENLEKAITCFENALEVRTREAFPEKWAQSLNNLGVTYNLRIRGDKAENVEMAIACFEFALEVRTRQAFPKDWATTQMNLGYAYSIRILGDKAENLEMAIQHDQNALQVYTLQAFPENWAQIQNNLGSAYRKRIKGKQEENLQQSITCCQNALRVYTRDAFPQMWASSQKNLGLIYTKLEQVAEAIECFESALEIYTPLSFPLNCFTTGINLGEIAFKSGDWQIAIKGYAAAIEGYEQLRTWITSEPSRQGLLPQAANLYENIVQACINTGELGKALEYVERSRGKSLVELMVNNDFKDGEIPQEVEELLQYYNYLQKIINQERDRHQSDPTENMQTQSRTSDRAAYAPYTQKIAELEKQKQLIWQRLRQKDPLLAAQKQVTAPQLYDMQRLIDQPTTAILSFYTTSNNTHVFVLRHNQLSCHTCKGQGFKKAQGWMGTENGQPEPINPAELIVMPASEYEQMPLQICILFNWHRQDIEQKEIIDNVLDEVAKKLQLEELISDRLQGIEELIIVPHLGLHLIPFAALPIGNNQYLGDRFLIRYIPSCQILEFCQQRGEVNNDLTYGIVEDATDDLPCASFEGEKIAEIFNIPKSQRLRGSSQATCNNYRQLAEQVQVLHCCHHAQFRLDRPLESVLKLGDGNITLGQLMTPSWRLSQLCDVFLACCETGLGVPELLTGDMFTISIGFLCAGARSVVSSLWSVNDLATALFSIFYYHYRKYGNSRPEALRQAQIRLCKLKKEELLAISKQTEIKRKEARNKRKQYPPGSAEYLEWDSEYRKYAGVTLEIDRVKNSNEEFPFSHPRYWAAFICQGLR
ncbi:TPR repeat-containing protein [Nostoc sp. NIES-4103]|nr:TPR repeat-containing protein [Nostoc sp. NIES-4103]